MPTIRCHTRKKPHSSSHPTSAFVVAKTPECFSTPATRQHQSKAFSIKTSVECAVAGGRRQNE
jgi:hypothetical protein